MPAPDLLDTILHGTPAELDTARAHVRASKGHGDRSLVARMEQAVADFRSTAITFDEHHHATMRAAGHEFAGSVFAVRSIA